MDWDQLSVGVCHEARMALHLGISSQQSRSEASGKKAVVTQRGGGDGIFPLQPDLERNDGS